MSQGVDPTSLQRTAGNTAVNHLLGTNSDVLPTSNSPFKLVENVLKSGVGRPLDTNTRRFMESRFSQNFGQVRIHSDSQAARSAHAIKAGAYTVGHDIVFADGAYQPKSSAGKALLAHELTHVVQQNGNTSKTPDCFSEANESSEQEAEQVQSQIHSQSVSVRETAPAGQVQRIGWKDVKEFWKNHIKPPTKKGGGEEGKDAESEESWKSSHEELLTHTKQAFWAGLQVLKKLRAKVIAKGGTSEELRAIDENIERLEKKQELFETGAKAFETGVKFVEKTDELIKFKEALEKVNGIEDPRSDEQSQEQALRAFDELFVASGRLFKLLPPGPWQAYGELLMQFEDNGGFFHNVGRNIGKHAHDADAVREDKFDTSRASPIRLAAPKTVEDIGPDVERKFNLAKSMNLLHRDDPADFERFKSAHEKFLAIYKKSKGNWFQERFPIFRKRDPKLNDEMKEAAKEEFTALQKLTICIDIAFMNREVPDASLGPDLDLIGQFTGE